MQSIYRSLPGLRHRYERLERSEGIVSEKLPADVPDLPAQEATSPPRLELEHLNRSLLAFYAVRPAKVDTDYIACLERAIRQKPHMREQLSSCLDGTQPFARLKLGEGRRLNLAAVVHTKGTGGIDLHIYEVPGTSNTKANFDSCDAIFFNYHVRRFLHEIYVDGISENDNAFYPEGREVAKRKFIALQLIAKCVTEASEQLYKPRC